MTEQERKCDLRGWQGIGGTLDIICEARKNAKSKLVKGQLGIALRSLKEACKITTEDTVIGAHSPWSESICE